MKFDYKRIGTRHKRPFIPITIRNPQSGAVVECYALLDSGSDTSLFAPVLGEIIGIDVKKGERKTVTGVLAGQREVCFEHTVQIVVSGWRFTTRVGFMPSLTSQAGEGLAGQIGFFDQFNFVKFDKRKEVVELGNFAGEPS